MVAEILPTEATVPNVAYWYGDEFASQCMDVQDDVYQGMLYDTETGLFSEYVKPRTITVGELQDQIDTLVLKILELSGV